MRASRSQTATSRPASRHVVTANVRGSRVHVRRALEVVIQHARRNVIAQDQPRRIGPFFVVKRILAGGALRPIPKRRRSSSFHQDDVAFGGAAEAGLKEMHQRHPDLRAA